MNERINIQDLTSLLAEKSIITKKEAENFIKQWVECVENGLIEDKRLRIKDLGTFKLTFLKDRESIDVATGERLVIPAHYKISFDVDNSLSETINEPFALFEPVEVAEEDSTEDTSKIKVTPELPTNNIEIEKRGSDEKKPKIATQIDLFEEQDEQDIPIPNITNMEKEEQEEQEERKEKQEEKEIKTEEKKTAPVTFQKKTGNKHEIISSADMEDNWDRRRRRKRREKRRKLNVNWKLILIILAVLLVFGIIKYINDLEEKDYYQRNRASYKISDTAKSDEENSKDSTDQFTTIPPDSINEANQDTITETETNTEIEAEKLAPEETKENVKTTPEEITENIKTILEEITEKVKTALEEITENAKATPEEITENVKTTPEEITENVKTTPEAVKTEDKESKTDQTQTQTPAQTQTTVPAQTPAQKTTPDQTQTTTQTQTTDQTQKAVPEQTQTAQNQSQTPAQTPAQKTTPEQTQTTQPPQEQAPKNQKKRKITDGDELTSIAQEEYGNMIFWIYIYLENNKVISNPNAVPNGTEIVIPPASKYKINKNDSESIKRATELQAQLF